MHSSSSNQQWLSKLFTRSFNNKPLYCGYSNQPYRIEVVAAPNDGMQEKMVKEREEKELKSLQSFQDLKNRIHSMQELGNWLFSEHSAYCSQCKGKKTVDYNNKELMDTY